MIHLPHSLCTREKIEDLLCTEEKFWNPLDGLLFYHKLGFYTPNVNPLVCWLKPYMASEVLKVRVPELHMLKKPCDYVNIHEHLLKKTKMRLKNL